MFSKNDDMKKVYLIGKVTGLDYRKTVKKFAEAEFRLRILGYEVVNPMKIIRNPTVKWSLAMRVCISTMLEDCDAIYLLPDWKLSIGAKLEYEVANQLQFYLVTEDEIERLESKIKEGIMKPLEI
jgi:hypothetical protein